MARGDRGCLCWITLITSSTMAGVTTGQLCLGMGDPLSACPAVNSLMYWLMLLRPISLLRVCLLRSEGTSRAYQESRSPDPASSGTSRQGRSQVRDSPSSGHQLASPSVSLKFPHGRLFVLSFFWCRPGLLARQRYEPHPRHIPARVSDQPQQLLMQESLHPRRIHGSWRFAPLTVNWSHMVSVAPSPHGSK